MTTDLKIRRRKVAWICFAPHLNEVQLMSAIAILQKSYQADGVNNLIAYVSKVCNEFGIFAATRKALYTQFYDLMTEEADLDFDPLSRLQSNSSVVMETMPAIILPRLHQTKPVPKKSIAAELTHEVSAVIEPAYYIIFRTLMGDILANFPEKQSFFEILKTLSRNKKNKLTANEIYVDAWSAAPASFAWTVDLPENKLAEMVHLVYTAVCELVGPIKADEAFHRAIATCEKMPEAKEFRPMRFF